MESKLSMTYESFTGNLLESFPEFRQYYLEQYQANEIDLLPSNISYDFIQYHDKPEVVANLSLMKKLTSFLLEMKNSGNEALIMLYNETVVDIKNTVYLKLLLNGPTKLVLLNPVPNKTPAEIKDDIKVKKMFLEITGKEYEENNKLLLEKYRNKKN